jgi:hypothetical protein
MEILCAQIYKALAEEYGWSLHYAEGFLKGKYSRRSGARLSPYAMVGLDDYCLGFRAGYFEHQNPVVRPVQKAAAREWALQSIGLGAPGVSSSATTLKPEFDY